METDGTWRSCRLPKGETLRDGPACLVREPRTDGPAPLLERWRRACVRPGAPDRLRRAPSDGAALPGRRARRCVASADGARERGVPSAARLGSGALAEPRSLLRCICADDAT